MASMLRRNSYGSLDEDLEYIEEFDALMIGQHETAEVKEKYPAKLHARKVVEELGVDDGLIYLTGKPSETYQDSDMGPAFRQYRYFYYLSGVDHEDCVLTYDIGKDFLQLFIPSVDLRTATFTGEPLNIEQCKAEYEVDDVAMMDSARRYLMKWLWQSKGASLYVLHADQIPSLLPPPESAGITRTDQGRLAAMAVSPYLNRVINARALLPAMDKARTVKTDYEIRMIRKACEISGEAHVNVLKGLQSFKNEAEVEACFTATCVAANAKHQSYPVIAGAGQNAATLHYIANDASLKGKQLMCLDAGAEWQCYASDITRTFPLSGSMTPEAKAIYSIVEKMQDTCIRAMRPGVVYQSLQVTAQVIALQGLMALGVLHNGTFFEYLKSGVSRAFFPHGLGHHVGLEVHDVDGTKKILSTTRIRGARHNKRELYSAPVEDDLAYVGPYGAMSRSQSVLANADADEAALKPGMILTVEPGIYFFRYAIENYHLKNEEYAKYINVSVLEKYYAVGGVRIEDVILVTTTGHQVLSYATPKGEAACKIIRGEA